MIFVCYKILTTFVTLFQHIVPNIPPIMPKVSDTWIIEELYLRIKDKGNMKYLYTLMNDELQLIN
jgi:transposase-like protein